MKLHYPIRLHDVQRCSFADHVRVPTRTACVWLLKCCLCCGSVWEHVQYTDRWNLSRFNVVCFTMWQNHVDCRAQDQCPSCLSHFFQSEMSVQFVICLSFAAFPYSTSKVAHLPLSVVTLKSPAVWTSEMRQCCYRGAGKSLARPGRKQARKHVRDARDFNNIEKRAVIKFFFSCKARSRRNFTPFWQKH